MAVSQGSQSGLLVEPGSSPHTFDTDSERYCFNYENLRKHGSINTSGCITGSRSNPKERTRQGAYLVRGVISIDASPAMLNNWLPRILGAAEVPTDTFGLAETLPAFGVMIDRVARRFEYTNCYVNRAVFRGRERNASDNGDKSREAIIECVMDIIGTTETSTATALPAASLAVTDNSRPYIFSDVTMTLQGSSRTVYDFVLDINNHLEVRWANSLTATSITPRDRTVTLAVHANFDTTTFADLYGQSLDGAAGTMLWTLTGLTGSTTWTFGTLQVPDNSPTIRGKTEIELPLVMTARTTGSTDEVSVVNAIT